MTPRILASRCRAAAARGDLPAFARLVRSANPRIVAAAWPRLLPPLRVAMFRALDERAAADVFAALDGEGRWLAYLGTVSDGAAPLMEGAPAARKRLFPPASASARARMRRALA